MNSFSINAELTSQRSLGDTALVQRTHLQDLTVSQFMKAVLLSRGAASFTRHIGAIVGRGAKEKMVNRNTGGHVALMADQHSLRNRAVCEFPRNAMGDPSKSTRAGNADYSVPGLCDVALPELAALRVHGADTLSKPQFKWRVTASHRAPADGVFLIPGRPDFKWSVAGFAGTREFGRLAGSHRSSLLDSEICGQARSAYQRCAGRFYCSKWAGSLIDGSATR